MTRLQRVVLRLLNTISRRGPATIAHINQICLDC